MPGDGSDPRCVEKEVNSMTSYQHALQRMDLCRAMRDQLFDSLAQSGDDLGGDLTGW